MSGSPSPIFRFSYLRLWREAWGYATTGERRTIIFYHAMYAVAVAISLIQPYILGKLVNALQAGGPHLFYDAAKLLGIMVLTSFSFWCLHGPGRIIERKTAKSIYIAYITRCYACLAEKPLSWHQFLLF